MQFFPAPKWMSYPFNEDMAIEASSMEGAISTMIENSDYNVDDPQSLVTREKSLKWLLNALYDTLEDERESMNQIQYSLRTRAPMYEWVDGSEVMSLSIDEMQKRHTIAGRAIKNLSKTTNPWGPHTGNIGLCF